MHHVRSEDARLIRNLGSPRESISVVTCVSCDWLSEVFYFGHESWSSLRKSLIKSCQHSNTLRLASDPGLPRLWYKLVIQSLRRH